MLGERFGLVSSASVVYGNEEVDESVTIKEELLFPQKCARHFEITRWDTDMIK